ncbi:carbon-nitrogen hydrolase family protein [Streptomyces smyrnaeus]|uniref:carbon-nitrogen hydrolase family protein n=1 Tax=Streptomyces TaxID=1883 RepID=UPI000C19BE8B|nr:MULTISPECIES: carbon-nitrogen hydrolase family protein [unclassified Streptomyces]MBQ0865544.1 carbon-nitrogen hydrolase family protein [Streptomyces sp. RK75]MBQ1124497.1 carbon-nitrogen hydrolase family protein [Streptomyces sp. B15]MBQ1162465.1 carbon-nitrogen hydrolase family protein [Streptomyces sp. A73]
MRIALHQTRSQPRTPGSPGLTALENAARETAARGARLLVTPELSLTGYALPDPAQLAEPAQGPGAAAVSRIARQHGVAIAYGYPERGEGGALHNSVQLIGPDGAARANYRKTHLYGPYEAEHYTPGDQLPVQAELDGIRFGLLICYDVEFPEAVRAHALAGTDVLLVPTALMRPYETVAETLVVARAVESQLYVAYANRVDREGEFDFAGLSCLAAPDGTVPVRAAGSGEALLVADIDPAALRASRERNPYLADRRPELYAH